MDTFLLAIAFLTFFATLFGYLFNKLKIPKVIGEIFGGIVLGPTFLGRIFPDFNSLLFNNNVSISVFSLLGLILLMFSSGFEIHPDFTKQEKKTVITIAITSIIIPFLCSWLLTKFFNLYGMMGSSNNYLAFKIIVAIAVSITSIPVISKIFFDLDIFNTQFAKEVLAIATIHDIVLWIFLSIATGLISLKGISLHSILIHTGLSVLFFIFALILIPFVINLIPKRNKKLIPINQEISIIFVVLFIFMFCARYFELNDVFGALLAGIVVKYVNSPNFNEIKSHIKAFSFSFFIPIYFATVGLKMDLINHFNFKFFFWFSLFALIIQGVTVLGTAKLLGHSLIKSMNLAMAINARGGPCIVLATIAYDYNIINASFFTTLIMLAIISSLISGIWLRYSISKKLLYNQSFGSDI
jgi:Kef-type K+ transport system membrane component KefB